MWKSMKKAWDHYSHPSFPKGPRANRSVTGSGYTDWYSDNTYLFSVLPDGNTDENGPYIDTSRSGLWVNGEEY